jgi:hypothetical protein
VADSGQTAKSESAISAEAAKKADITEGLLLLTFREVGRMSAIPPFAEMPRASSYVR